MPTVWNRINAYAKSKKVPILNQLERIAVGKQLAAAYHEQKINLPLHRVEKQEPEGTFLVICYPHQFLPTMDATISIAYENRIPVKKRKRIPTQPILAYQGKIKTL